jgi:hypothetical protein
MSLFCVEVGLSREDHRRYNALLERIRVLESTTPKQEGVSTSDIVLWCLAGVMAVALYLAPDKTPLIVLIGLLCMVLLATHPALHLPWVVNAATKRAKGFRAAIAMAGTLLVVGLYGWNVWPSIKRHPLTTQETKLFENGLKTQKGDDLQIQLACPPNDEKGCTYAGQFIRPIGDSGWNVQSVVARLPLTRPMDGIMIYRRGGDKDYMLKHYDAGGWFNNNEPHLLAMQKAFQSIDIEPSGGTDPDLPDNVMMIYFGPERENEAEPTDLTRSTEWATGKREGPFPGKRRTFLCRWLGLSCG